MCRKSLKQLLSFEQNLAFSSVSTIRGGGMERYSFFSLMRTTLAPSIVLPNPSAFAFRSSLSARQKRCSYIHSLSIAGVRRVAPEEKPFPVRFG